MKQNLYYGNLYLFLERKEIPELLALWRESIYLGNFGAITRAIITKSIPALAKHYDVEITDGTTFSQFVEAYYEKMYTNQCNLDPLQCVGYFASIDDRKMLELARKKAQEIWESKQEGAWHKDHVQRIALLGAVEGRQLELVKILSQEAKKSLDLPVPRYDYNDELYIRDTFKKAVTLALEERYFGIAKYLLE